MTIKEIEKSAKSASKKAIEEAFANGLPITVKKGKRIIRLFPDGKIETVSALDRAFIKTKKKTYKI